MKYSRIKRCYHCGLHKTPETLHRFHKNGTDDYCKQCRKIIAHTYYLRKREQVLTKNAEWATNNAEKFETTRKKWREDHPDKLLEYDRKWKAEHKEEMRQRERERYDPEKAKAKNAKFREEHPEKHCASKKRWNQANPDKVKAHNAAGRARRRNAPVSDFTAKDWQFLKDLHHYSCAYCGKQPQRLTQEHVTPLTRGGNHTLSNVLPACGSCNSKMCNDKYIIPLLLRCADGSEKPVTAYSFDIR